MDKVATDYNGLNRDRRKTVTATANWCALSMSAAQFPRITHHSLTIAIERSGSSFRNLKRRRPVIDGTFEACRYLKRVIHSAYACKDVLWPYGCAQMRAQASSTLVSPSFKRVPVVDLRSTRSLSSPLSSPRR